MNNSQQIIFEIRRMEFSDLKDVLRLEKEIFSDAWNEAMFSEEITKHDAFVLYSGNEIVGYICGWLLYEEYNITNVAIDPEFQKMGLGTKLVKFVIEYVAEKKCPIIFLEVRESNYAAINLYEKNGFSIVGKRKKYYKNPEEDALLMVLSVKETNER